MNMLIHSPRIQDNITLIKTVITIINYVTYISWIPPLMLYRHISCPVAICLCLPIVVTVFTWLFLFSLVRSYWTDTWPYKHRHWLVICTRRSRTQQQEHRYKNLQTWNYPTTYRQFYKTRKYTTNFLQGTTISNCKQPTSHTCRWY